MLVSSSTSTVNFNGGMLLATTSDTANAPFLTYVDNAVVQDDGAIIDTQGYSVRVGVSLVHGGINPTDGGLTKLGSGTLTLTGVNTYNGGTNFNAGTVAIVARDQPPGQRPAGLQRRRPVLHDHRRLGQPCGNTASLNASGTANFVNVAAEAKLLFPARSAGPGATLTGPGILVLNNSNNYYGGTNFNGGAISIPAAAALGSGPLSFNGGGLSYTTGSVSDTLAATTATLNASGTANFVNIAAGTTLAVPAVISGAGTHRDRPRHAGARRQQQFLDRRRQRRGRLATGRQHLRPRWRNQGRRHRQRRHARRCLLQLDAQLPHVAQRRGRHGPQQQRRNAHRQRHHHQRLGHH